VAGVDHPLAKAEKVDRRLLARYRQLLMTPRFLEDEEAERISPRLWRADSLYAIAEQAALGLGWAVLPLNVARYPTVNGRLVEIAARDLSFAPLEVRLYWRAGQGESSVLAWLRQFLARAVFAAAS
jgi:DNA-binding transcriptional LysR family regulator